MGRENMSNSVVKELQQEILSTECDILNVLRKAHVIASRLNLCDFDSWIMDELNGYDEDSKIPQYRNVYGLLFGLNPYRGYVSASIKNTELLENLCNRKMSEPISALVDLYDKSSSEGTFQLQICEPINSELNKLFNAPFEMQFILKIGIHQLKQIIEHVKDCLLQWTIELEKTGIMGEGLSFTQKEKDIAKSATTINNFYGSANIVNAPINNSQIISGDNNEIAIEYENPEDLLQAIKESLNNETLTTEDRETADELVDDLSSKVKEKKKTSIIKATLSGLKDFLISVGAAVTAGLIQTGISMLG